MSVTVNRFHDHGVQGGDDDDVDVEDFIGVHRHQDGPCECLQVTVNRPSGSPWWWW